MSLKSPVFGAIMALLGLGAAATAQPAQQPAVRLTGIRSPAPVAPASSPQRPAEPLPPPDRPPDLYIPDSPAPVAGSPEQFIPVPAPDADPQRNPLSSSWSNGLRFQSDDDAFHIHVGGNAQVDSTWLSGTQSAFDLPNNGGTSGIGDADATFLRRVRLRLEGDVFDQFDYVVEYDLANANNENDGLQPASFGNITGAPAPANIWLQVRDVPFYGNVRFGNQTKPIGFSNHVAQTFLPFMERDDNMDAFYGPFDSGFALGLSARNHSADERVTWQYGVYRPAINVFGIGINKGEVGGRVTALPVYANDGRVLVHVGLGTLDGELPQNKLRVRARPLLRNGPGYANPVLVDTGNINGSRQYTIAPEFAAVLGPWTLQAEWTGQFLTQATPANLPNQGTVFYHGGYVQLLYFLTGEYQSYDKKEGSFGRVTPDHNLRFKKGCCEGCGAWQVGARVGYLDLNDKAIQGGTLYDCTFGLNWYWNPNMKVQFNYVVERRDQPGVPVGWINGVGVRAAYDF